MKEFCYVAKNMFNFKGRARRREFWLSLLICYGILYAVMGVSLFIFNLSLKEIIAGTLKPQGDLRIILSIALLLITSIWSLFFHFAVTIRRLHDLNKSGWTLLGCIIGTIACCGIGNLILLIYLCKDGMEGKNKYGPNPKDSFEAANTGSVAPAIIILIIGLIIFVAGYLPFLKNCIDGAGGWDAIIADSAAENSFDNPLSKEKSATNEYGIENTEALPANMTDDVSLSQTSEVLVDSDGPSAWVIGTSKNNPAPLGTWIESKAYSAVDDTYHVIYFRVTDIISGESAEQTIQDYNKTCSNIIENLESSELEYRIIQYEVSIPSDFPAEKQGLSSLKVDFYATGTEEDGIHFNDKTYYACNPSHDITGSFENDVILPGTLVQRQAVITMAKGVHSYLLEARTSDDENAVSEYIIGK